MEIQIISREIVKPITLTSTAINRHQKTYKLSLLDQLAPPLYVPFILFYSASSENPSKISSRLRNSLSETLTHFYPLAGRVKDDFTIDCNDEGATYIEARVSGKMSEVIQEPDINELKQLLPISRETPSDDFRNDQEILAVQVNHFDCGGVAITLCVWHVIADASALATFVKSWADVASSRGAAHNFDGVIHDCTSLFPPEDMSGFSLRKFVKEDVQVKNILTKRFLFDGSKVAALRKKIGNGPFLERPTRFEAVAALIWGALKVDSAVIPVNLRKRMNPPVPQQAIGNIYHMTVASWPRSDEHLLVDHNGLAGKIHDSVMMIENDYIRNLHEGGGYFKMVRKSSEEHAKSAKRKVFGFSSWCKFPFYEADFGWGKPVWLCCALVNEAAVLLDTSDGEGIEAWVGFTKEDMVKFQQDPDILAYASFSPNL